MSRCLQHEADHLRGVLFLDRLAGAERRAAFRQLRRQQAAAAAAGPG